MAYTSFLDPVLMPFLSMPTYIAIPLISLIISLLVTILYKYTTDQKLIKDIKAKMKVLQKDIRGIKDPKKAMEKNKEVMQLNSKLMGQTMKSTLYTIIPMLFIFAWFNAHLTFVPILPSQEFNLTITGISDPDNFLLKLNDNIYESSDSIIKDNSKTFFLTSDNAGNFIMFFEHNGNEYTKKVTITNNAGQYENPLKELDDDIKLSIGMDKLRPMGNLSIFGWRPGWIGSYVIFSLIFSMLIRKLMKVA